MIDKSIDHVPSTFDKETMKILLMTCLGILTKEKAIVAVAVGATVKLTWLVELYHWYVESRSFVWATKSYLLHLVNSRYLSTSHQLTSMSRTSFTSVTWMIAMSMRGESLHWCTIRPSLLCQPVHQQASYRLCDIAHGM